MAMGNTVVGILGAAALALAGCGGQNEADAAEGGAQAERDTTLGAVIGTVDELAIASEVIGNADLEDPFGGAGSYTIFLPRNEAFEALPEGDLARLRSDSGRDGVVDILSTHIAVGVLSREDLDDALEMNGGSMELTSVTDKPILLRKVGNDILIGDGEDAPRLTGTARAASNGFVHVIDGFIPSDD